MLPVMPITAPLTPKAKGARKPKTKFQVSQVISPLEIDLLLLDPR